MDAFLLCQRRSAGTARRMPRAGAVARRIVSYLHEGQVVGQGDELGFIKFGSRCDILLPLGVEIKVRLGDKVLGNRTVIAELSQSKSKATPV